MVKAIDIAILAPEPVKGLAIKLSRQINPPDFCLNEVDILPHITLGIGFVEEEQITNTKYLITNIVNKLESFEVVVERIEGRYLMCKKTDELFNLHKAICDAVEFVHLPLSFPWKRESMNGSPTPSIRTQGYSRSGMTEEEITKAYFVKKGEEIDRQTLDFTNNFKWRNAYSNFVPHITLGWEDGNKLKGKVESEKLGLPMKFGVAEISVCQLGNKNTCRKVLGRVKFS